MERKIIRKTNLPSHMKEMTIQELVDACDEINIKGNVVTMKKITEEGIFSVEYKAYAGASSVRQVSVPKYQIKKDYAEMVYEMKRDGMTQKEIASKLDISQAYVSKLLRG